MTTPKNKVSKTARSGKTKVAAIIGATTLLIGASFGVQAVADSKVYQHAKLYITNTETVDDNPFVKKAGWGKRGHHRRFSEMSDAEIEKRVSRMVKHVAIEIDATDEQTQKITALVSAVAKDMKPLRGEFRSAGEEMQKLLTAGTIDRVAMERIRAERIATADKVSKELMNTVADVAEVLTAEQRQILEERIQQFKSMRRRWHRG